MMQSVRHPLLGSLGRFGYPPRLSGDVRTLDVDSPLGAVVFSLLLCQRIWGENRTVLSVVGSLGEYTNSKTKPFVFLWLYVICRLGTH